MSEKIKTVPCPTCGKAVEWSTHSRWRPFCSERCYMVDLGAWLDESRRIPGEELPLESGNDDEPWP
jgi:endogenous inhibitor of DNA gyrase (YacG/DUF329 family)